MGGSMRARVGSGVEGPVMRWLRARHGKVAPIRVKSSGEDHGVEACPSYDKEFEVTQSRPDLLDALQQEARSHFRKAGLTGEAA